jgi:hypothetical protein
MVALGAHCLKTLNRQFVTDDEMANVAIVSDLVRRLKQRVDQTDGASQDQVGKEYDNKRPIAT